MKAVVQCPKCRRSIPLEDVNVATDMALCRSCGERWSYAEVCEELGDESIDGMSAPAGAWLSPSAFSFEVGATTRSAAAFFLVPFMCVWSGFSLGGIYGRQFATGQWSLFPSLFGIPFLLGTVYLGSTAIMAVCGKVVVRSDGDQATIFTGVGPIGWRRRFAWREVKSIRLGERTRSKGRTIYAERAS